jgi:hypothetical protein
MAINMINFQKPITSPDAGAFHQLKKISEFPGKAMVFFKTGIQVQDSEHQPFFLSLSQVTEALFGPVALPCKSRALIHKRILEIVNPDTRLAAPAARVEELFCRIHNLKKLEPQAFSTAEEITTGLELLKLEMANGPHFSYDEDLSELKQILQPGDILVRKYHEDHSNIICTAQHFFRTKGLREAYKCSHLALYVGEMQETPWIAEATYPDGNDVQVHRIKLDDPRFQTKNKNQYLIFRNKDSVLAQESARLAKNYAVKMLPRTERTSTPKDQKRTFRFNSIEAIRSLWHSSKLNIMGAFRHLKIFADYHNKIPFEYLGKRRKFYCSHFVITMQALAEMKTNSQLKSFFEKHPPPKKYNETLKGTALKIAKLWYSIKKELWAFWMAICHHKELKKAFQAHLDPLRTAPHKVVNYMLDHKEQFEFVGTISRSGDLALGK